MPTIKQYRTTRDKREATGEELVNATDVLKFREDKLFLYPGWREEPAVYGWSPDYPCASYGHFGTIPDEALYRSNYDATLEVFKEELDLELETGSSDTFELPVDNMQAIALACRMNKDFSDYPVVDEERMSELENELTEEAYTSHGRDDLVKALATLLPAELAEELLDEDEVREEYKEHAEPYLKNMARSVVGYSGDMYFGYKSKYGESWESLEYALGEVTGGIWLPGNKLGLEQLLDGLVRIIRAERIRAEREEFERYQSPLVTVEEDE